MKRARHVIKYDIIQNTEQKLFCAIDEFMTSYKDNTTFEIHLETRHEMETDIKITKHDDEFVYFVDDERIKDIGKTKEYITDMLYIGNIVFCYYEVKEILKLYDLSTDVFMFAVKNALMDKKDSEYLEIDVFKPQTHTKIFINHADGMNFLNVHVANIVDIDLLGIDEINGRPPIYVDSRHSKTRKHILTHVRNLVKTFERYSLIDCYVETCSMTLLMNLSGIIRYKYVDITEDDDVTRDRIRYRSSYTRHELIDEIMETAWHPDRFGEWCLADDERVEINANFTSVST